MTTIFLFGFTSNLVISWHFLLPFSPQLYRDIFDIQHYASLRVQCDNDICIYCKMFPQWGYLTKPPCHLVDCLSLPGLRACLSCSHCQEQYKLSRATFFLGVTLLEPLIPCLFWTGSLLGFLQSCHLAFVFILFQRSTVINLQLRPPPPHLPAPGQDVSPLLCVLLHFVGMKISSSPINTNGICISHTSTCLKIFLF